MKKQNFRGGINAFRNILIKNINTNNIKEKGKISSEGHFIVDEQGRVIDIKTVGNNYSLNVALELALKKQIITKYGNLLKSREIQ